MAIGVDLDEIRTSADSYREESGNVEEVISACDALNDEMADFWEGSAATAFLEQWEELKPSLEAAVELLDGVGTQLDGVADTMEETDEALASSMQQ